MNRVKVGVRLWCVVASTVIASAGALRADTGVKTAGEASLPSVVGTDLLVWAAPGQEVGAIAAHYGGTISTTLQGDIHAAVIRWDTSDAATAALQGLLADSRIRAAQSNTPVVAFQRAAFVPNDPYYNYNNPAGYPGQWHLNNNVPGGTIDARLQGAWNRNLTGNGVVVGVVDDSFETGHPDLAPNYLASASYNFGSYVGNNAANNPNPFYSDDRHGISVAGVIGARGGNGTGVTGAAPYASLAGLRIDFPAQTTAMFVDAVLYKSSGADRTIQVKNHSYGISVPFVNNSAETVAANVSASAGTIHLYAAGNDRGGTGEDAGKKMILNSPNVIPVAALGYNGVYSWYSSYGANVFVTAPSNGSTYGITTTDRTGALGYGGHADADYTSNFGGTSSATPLVAGIIALGKQVNPNMDVRLAKHLLARTSRVVNATDNTVSGGGNGVTAGSAWKTNAAGFEFNQNYGFGLVDADAFTQAAAQFVGVTPVITQSTGQITTNLVIPDNNATGVFRDFTLTGTTVGLEEVLVTMNLSHTWAGDLTATLRSPSGTTHRLFQRAGGDNQDFVNTTWTFRANGFWGENPFGTWRLTIADVFATDVGTLNWYSVTAYSGELVAVPEPASVLLLMLAGPLLLRRRRV